MAIYEITDSDLRVVPGTSFAAAGLLERADLQRLLREHIGVISPDTLVIAEEFGDWDDSKRRIDLLGIDKSATLVVVELKRTDDGGRMELQALRYAAMVSTMTFDQAVEAYRRYLQAFNRDEDPQIEMLQFLGWDEPDEEAFAQDVRIVLASASFSRELATSVMWLNERSLDIRCVRLKPYKHRDTLLLDIQQVIPLPEAADYIVGIKQKATEAREARRKRPRWTGVWFVNVGMDDSSARDWEKCRELGFLSAGGGIKYSEPLYKLEPGSHVVAYQRGCGYVGYGIVRQSAAPAHELRLANGSILGEQFPELGRRRDDPTKQEHGVGVEWLTTVPLSGAKRFTGAFANQNVVCKLRDPATLEFLKQELAVKPPDEQPRSVVEGSR